MGAKLRTCLLFGGNAEEAVDFYMSLLPDSRVERKVQPLGEETVAIEFILNGTPMLALNGPPEACVQAPGMSIAVLTADQAETDRLWERLDGEAKPCGWKIDRFGVHWQVVPERLPELFNAPDKAASKRAFDAMLTMQKIDIAAVEAAFHNTSAPAKTETV